MGIYLGHTMETALNSHRMMVEQWEYSREDLEMFQKEYCGESKWVERKVASMMVQLEYMMGTKLVLVMENQRVDRSVVQRVQ